MFTKLVFPSCLSDNDYLDYDEEDRVQDLAPVGIPKEIIPAMRKAFSNLCTCSSGVLFENSFIQVGLKHEYQAAQGRITVFLET